MKSSLRWIDFREKLDAVEERCGYATLDVTAKRVLEWVARSEKTLPAINIQTVIMKSGVASPATLHKNLAVLEREGFLEITVDKNDTRRRVVSVSRKGHKTLERLSAEVLQVYRELGRG